MSAKKRARQRDVDSDNLFANCLRQFRWRAVCVTGRMCSEAVLARRGETALYADSGYSAEATPYVRLSRLPHREARLSRIETPLITRKKPEISLK